jgi:4-hydroxy-tetrahydrodipicolinate reductase
VTEIMRLAVAGAAGRMGQTLIRTIATMPGCRLAGALERPGSPALGRDCAEITGVEGRGIIIRQDARDIAKDVDGILDFTAPAASVATAAFAAENRLVHVIGTTGLTPAQDAQIAEAAKRTPIVRAGNMSLGVNLLVAMTRKIAAALDDDFDVEIIEMHHKHKVDAPSGTALMLGRAAAEGRGIDLTQHSVRARDGHTGERPRGAIGFATLRGGNVVGEHTVIFSGENERIEITHKATDRAIFARGAIKAALWARGRAPGLYSMADVLGL